ncbi:MAG: DUF1638 domain-containing protein [Abditibacteriota bacterium]|nr:DUF1638 domain-containing protein [Abditibacteriota bacterium]
MNKAALYVCRPQETVVRGLLKESGSSFDVNVISMTLHRDTERLKEYLQQQINSCSGLYSYMFFCLGLCGRAVVGLRALETPCVFIRAHDCITFALGSRARYMKLFKELTGTYFFTPGWLEAIKNREADSEQFVLDPEGERELRNKLTEKYGEDNGEFLFEMETGWIKNYRRAMFIGDPRRDDSRSIAYLNDICRRIGWDLVKETEDYSLLRAFVAGDVSGDDFLVLRPGYEVYETGDERVIDGRPAS